MTTTTTETVTYYAGLVLINSLTISGIDAYLQEFNVNNSAQVTFINSELNVFEVPATATCAFISTIIAGLKDDAKWLLDQELPAYAL